MATAKYKVLKNLVFNGKRLLPGDTLNEGQNQVNYEKLIKNGFLIKEEEALAEKPKPLQSQPQLQPEPQPQPQPQAKPVSKVQSQPAKETAEDKNK